MLSVTETYACGEEGTFMKTADSGVTWKVKTDILGFKKTFRSLSFIDKNYGMCCGDSGWIIKSTDAGTTWQRLVTNTKLTFNSILVVDKNNALAIALNGGIFKTTDGGSSWAVIPTELNYTLYNIHMIRPDFIVVSGYAGVLMRSADTGRSWFKIETGYGNTLFSSCFTDDKNITAIGDAGFIIHSGDGGTTWSIRQVSIYPVTATLLAIDGKNGGNITAVGNDGNIIVSTDNGMSWQYSPIGSRASISSISYFDKMNAMAVGNGVILRTTDGGSTWVFLPETPEVTTLYSIAFPKGDTSLGLAVGKEGTIMRTTNGGKVWKIVASGTGYTLRCVTFLDSINVMAVGEYGTIIKSTDGGVTWALQLSETRNNLNSVSFATPIDGLVVGDSNTCLKTYSAGQFWTREFVATPPASSDQHVDYFRSVSYPDKMHAFMTGYHAYYLSNDGGVNWKFNWINPDDSTAIAASVIHSLSFTDSLYGAMLRSWSPGEPTIHWFVDVTRDGGATWNSVETPHFTSLNAIQCFDRMHTTIVGHAGYIIHSTDGCVSFNEQTSNTLNELYGVCFGTLGAGNAVGLRGNIIRISTDEKPTSAVLEHGASGSPKISIDAIYPNPFSTSTTIVYHLPSAGIITVEIYSLEGKIIASLANEYKSSGDQSIRFDGVGLPSGTYLCKILCNGLSAEGEIKIIR